MMPVGVVLFLFLDDFAWVPGGPAAEAFMGPIIIPLRPSSKQFAGSFFVPTSGLAARHLLTLRMWIRACAKDFRARFTMRCRGRLVLPHLSKACRMERISCTSRPAHA